MDAPGGPDPALRGPDALTGRVALVTGASRRAGIGAAVARRLAADGLRVVTAGWPAADGGAGTAAAVDLEADLADPGAPAALVGAAVERCGRLDVVVACHARSSTEDLDSLTARELDATWAVNVRATLLLVQALAAARAPGPGGRVVLFTSGQWHAGMTGELPYVASKGALHQLAASLAMEVRGRGITVNALDPGPTDTGFAGADVAAEVAARHPAGRWGTPEDAARAVSWLVSDEAGWVTGQVLASDGGWSVAPRP